MTSERKIKWSICGAYYQRSLVITIKVTILIRKVEQKFKTNLSSAMTPWVILDYSILLTCLGSVLEEASHAHTQQQLYLALTWPAPRCETKGTHFPFLASWPPVLLSDRPNTGPVGGNGSQQREVACSQPPRSWGSTMFRFSRKALF